MPPRREIIPNRRVPIKEGSSEEFELSEKDFELLTSLVREKGENGRRIGIRTILERFNGERGYQQQVRLQELQAILRENEAYFNSIGIEIGKDLPGLGEFMRERKQIEHGGPTLFFRKLK